MVKPSTVLADVKYRDWEFFVAEDESYLQVRFVDGREAQHGRKWRLSSFMTKSEVVQTALAAVLAAEEHEAREKFTYHGRAIFGPHFDVDSLFALATLENTDTRKSERRT